VTLVSTVLLAGVAGSVAFAVLRARRTQQAADVPRLARALDSAPLRWQLLATAAVVTASAAFLLVLGWSVDLVDGYEKAQRSTAAQLRRMSEARWTALANSAGRDLVWYAPSYPLWGILVVLGTGHRRCRPPARPPDHRRPFAARRDVTCRLGPLGMAAVWALVVAGASDIGETSLFRTSLEQLRRHGITADVKSLTSLTRALYGCKWLAVASSLVLVIAGLFVRRPRNAADPERAIDSGS